MVWKRLFGTKQETSPPVPPAGPQPDASGVVRRLPAAADPAQQSRLDTLRRRRDMAVYDLERAQAARQPENPWQERIDLLDRSLATVADDLRALDAISPVPFFTLLETPITDISVQIAEPASVAFTIGPERFLWEEEIDWDQRGGPVVRGQLQQRSGNAAALVPPDAPSDRREVLAQHLVDSATVFAFDLRDRALEGEPLPDHPTLADLAGPCPECGDWRDWKGHCATCAERAWRRQSLLSEADRLTRERDEEIEDRHKWAERFPVARKRLADIDAEIAGVERR